MLLKLAFIDIGELGWSLYLSAHVRWLKKNTDSMIAVISFPDRKCLFTGLADIVIDVPEAFYKKYDLNMQDSYRLRHVKWEEIKDFFSSYIPEGYCISNREGQLGSVYNNELIYVPYGYSKPPENGKEIIVFPRYRVGLWARRNLPEDFYSRLVKRLCNEFPDLTIRTIGIKNGAYDIKVNKSNYINWVGKGDGLQDVIDRCQSAVAAIGSQSAPPKISLLQGVPTFMIGHQKKVHAKTDNWMTTKVGFYEVDKREYAKINIKRCIKTVVAFVKETQ